MKTINHVEPYNCKTTLVFESEQERDDYFSKLIAELTQQYRQDLAELVRRKEQDSVVEGQEKVKG